MADETRSYPDDKARMRLAIDLARRNVEQRTGGPFGAAIFAAGSGQLIAVGVNRVVPLNNSTAHAEMMAFMMAQARLGHYRLDGRRERFILATSAQPCAMCYGATPWAGIHRMIIGANKDDVETLTDFDEGPLPADWIGELNRRGIEVVQGVLRDEARAVFQLYREIGGAHY